MTRVGAVTVVGAAGKTGQAVLKALVSQGSAVRAAVRHPGQRDEALALGAADATVVDLVTGAGLEAAFDGSAAAYHLAPNVHPDEVPIMRRVLAAAEATALPHLTFHSVLHPHDTSMRHHRLKAEAEDLLRGSSLRWTVLRPAAYLQNFLPGIAEGELVVPYRLDAPFTFVDLADVADVAASTLTDPRHAGQTYDLAGDELLTVAAMAQIASVATGSPVTARSIDVRTWRSTQGSALDEWASETLTQMFLAYDDKGLVGEAQTLTALLGRRPAGLAEVLGRR